MKGREALVAIARGGQAPRQPVIAFGPHPDADGVVVPLAQLAEALAEHEGAAVLVRVDSPLTRALGRELGLTQTLHDDPPTGEAQLSALVEEAREEAQAALDRGADGIAYWLDGAYPAATTPMEYGGHYLELDRGLLDAFAEARFNLVFVEGLVEPYLDFVSDLPAHAFGWRAEAAPPAAVRPLRPGPLATTGDGADILLVGL